MEGTQSKKWRSCIGAVILVNKRMDTCYKKNKATEDEISAAPYFKCYLPLQFKGLYLKNVM
jgi:hypothetical protein